MKISIKAIELIGLIYSKPETTVIFISVSWFIVQNDKKLMIKRQPRPWSSLQKMRDTFESITSWARSPSKEHYNPKFSIKSSNLRYTMSNLYKSK